MEKLQPVAEYISVSDIVEIAKNLKEVVDDLKEKLLNSEEDIRNKVGCVLQPGGVCQEWQFQLWESKVQKAPTKIPKKGKN